MRVALVADIHGNLVALDAVLERLANENIDVIVSLGDVASWGPQPAETLDRLREIGSLNVMGNTDEWVLDPKPHAIRDADTPRVNHIELWCIEHLTPDHKDFLRTFRRTVEIPLTGSMSMLCYHGSPRTPRDFLRATTPDLEVDAMLGGHAQAVMVGGHTHEQMLRRHRECILINAGSVGQASEWGHNTGRRHYPWAEYAVVTAENGAVEVELGRVPFDVAAVSQIAHDRCMPHATWWASLWA